MKGFPENSVPERVSKKIVYRAQIFHIFSLCKYYVFTDEVSICVYIYDKNFVSQPSLSLFLLPGHLVWIVPHKNSNCIAVYLLDYTAEGTESHICVLLSTRHACIALNREPGSSP